MTLSEPVPKVAAAPEAMVDAVGGIASSLNGNDAEKNNSSNNSSIKDSDSSPSPPNEKDSIKDGKPDNSQQELVQQEPPAHLTGIKLVTVCVSVMLAVLCIALDNTILATAIPRITDTFDTVDDIAWYGSAYLLSTCSLQLLYTKFYTFFHVKWVFLTALIIFEAGSIVCGAASTSMMLVIGRAIAGMGSAGLFTGATTAVVLVAPVRKRPAIAGMIGGVFGCCGIIGPLLGGVFADQLTWRWCFYINLPIGAIAAAGVLTFLRVDQPLRKLDGSLLYKIRRFDPLGNLCFIAAIICLLLAVHWGGREYSYSSARFIILLVVFGVLLICFIAIQRWQGDNAIVPARIALQRTILSASLFALSLGGTIFVIIYHLPLYFQVIQNVSPLLSAIHTLPVILSQLTGTILAGILTTRLGYYMPFVYISAVLMPLGVGLLTTFSVTTPTATWIGYLIILGFGQGCGFQQGNVACQVVLPLADVPVGTAVVFSMQFLGGTVFLSVAQSVFSNRMRHVVENLDIEGITTANVAEIGATTLRKYIPEAKLEGFLEGYANAVTSAFKVALVMACLASVGAAGMEWRSVKQKGEQGEKSQMRGGDEEKSKQTPAEDV